MCEVSSDSSPSIGDTAAAQRMSSNEERISGGTVCTQREFWKVTSMAVAVKDHGNSTPFGAGAGDLVRMMLKSRSFSSGVYKLVY